MLLQGKVVAITGAARGLGLAYAKDVARRGAALVLVDDGSALDGAPGERELLEKVARGLRAEGAQVETLDASVADPATAKALVSRATSRFGKLDALINNAGILRDASLLEVTVDDLQAVLSAHLFGSFLCTQAAAEEMSQQEEGGAILNTISMAGLRGNVGQSAYAMAKAAIFGLTRTAALELSLFDVRVNAIAPLANTRMTEGMSFVGEDMSPEQVAPLASYLVSDLSRAVNGRVFGAHGSYLFEYAMGASRGVKDVDAWTPELIHERFGEISGHHVNATEAPQRAEQAEVLEGIFAHLAETFRARRARRWAGTLHFRFSDAEAFTVSVADGACEVAAGIRGLPSCTVETDTETFLSVLDGADGQRFFVEGRFVVNDLGEVARFVRCFNFKKARAAYLASASASP